MQKTSTNLGGKGNTVDFRPDKKSFTAPEVVDRYQNDEGDTILILASGNEIPEIRYNAMWFPVKTAIRPLDKGINPNFRKLVK